MKNFHHTIVSFTGRRFNIFALQTNHLVLSELSIQLPLIIFLSFFIRVKTVNLITLVRFKSTFNILNT